MAQNIPPEHVMVLPGRLGQVIRLLLAAGGIRQGYAASCTVYPDDVPFGPPHLTSWPFLLVSLAGTMRAVLPQGQGTANRVADLVERDAVLYGPGTWPSIERTQTRAHLRVTFADDGVLVGVRDWRRQEKGCMATPGALELCLLERAVPVRVQMLLGMALEPGPADASTRVTHALNLVLDELARAVESTGSSPRIAAPRGWVALREYLRQHAHESPGRGQAAAALGITARHVSRLCRAAGAGSYLGYLDRLRTERAMALLLQPRMMVKQAAAACGFSSVNYFVRVFRKRTGTTPGKWRQGCLMSRQSGSFM